MEVITEIKVNYKTFIFDNWDDKQNLREIKDSVEQHIDDWLEEHNLTREDIKYTINFEEREDKPNYTLKVNDKVYINDILINEDIFQEEISGYKPCYREDEIDMLFNWISECDRQSEKDLMIEDLKYLQTLDDEWIWSNISTNEFIAKSDDVERFNEICKEILEINEELK